MRRRNLFRSTSSSSSDIDFKDLNILRRFITETGKIVPRRLSGATAKEQRELARAIKQARFAALLPFCDQHH